MEMRGPYDVANLGCLFGLDPSAAKACMLTNARAVLVHAETRTATYRGVASIAMKETLAVKRRWEAADVDDEGEEESDDDDVDMGGE